VPATLAIRSAARSGLPTSKEIKVPAAWSDLTWQAESHLGSAPAR
jgi:hypothetical protein